MNKKKCTARVMGVVTDVRSRGLDFPDVITVSYTVNDIKYSVRETIKLKSEIIKLGFLPVGQRKTPVMGNTQIGTGVEISYDPDKPERAYITENKGIMNC